MCAKGGLTWRGALRGVLILPWNNFYIFFFWCFFFPLFFFLIFNLSCDIKEVIIIRQIDGDIKSWKNATSKQKKNTQSVNVNGNGRVKGRREKEV